MNRVVKSEIVLVRGLPGSGKSTLAKGMSGYGHFEADMFFEVDGLYRYDPERARVAHTDCRHSVIAMAEWRGALRGVLTFFAEMLKARVGHGC